MELATIQFIIYIAIAAIVLLGIAFIVSDARAHRRDAEQYTNRNKSARASLRKEHEPA